MKGEVSSEAEPPTKKQKKVNTQNESEADAAGNESESDAAGKGSSEKEGSKELELENKATLTTIVNTLDIICRKFDQVDSRLEAYELDRNRPLMDQKTNDDGVNALLEELLKDLGIGKILENMITPLHHYQITLYRKHHRWSLKRNQGKLEKESGVKRALDEEFGSVDKDIDMRLLDFLVISPAKATKDDKSTKDDKAAKDPAYGCGCRRTRIFKGEEANEKKKAAHADAAFKRKGKAEAKKKAAEDKKKEAEAKKKRAAAKKKVAEAKKKKAELRKKQEAELKKQNQAGSKYKKVTPPRDGVTRCNVQPDVEDSSLADITDEVLAEQNEFAPESDVENSELVRSAIIKEFREKNVRLTPKGLSTTAVSSSFDFPMVGHDGTTCMRKNVTPSSAIYDPLAHVDPMLLEKLMQHIKTIPPKPPAPPGKKEVLTADHESDFYSILIYERPWSEAEYGWVFDNKAGFMIGRHTAQFPIILRNVGFFNSLFKKFSQMPFERGKRNAEIVLRHLFKWADECLVEEVDDIKSLISGMNKNISEFRVNVALLEKEIEVMKTTSGEKEKYV
uniref:Uncharacterized protein n=1 Tax=Brassica campestris TaxID=3711 RepID=M4F5P8_BRACM